MSEHDETPTFADHVIPGGAPDPVVSTAPQAAPALDDVDADVDDQVASERPAVFPPVNPQTGVVPPPSAAR